MEMYFAFDFDDDYVAPVLDHNTDGWNKATDIRHFFDKHAGERYNDFMQSLKLVDVREEAYRNWMLFRDADGNWYDDYVSIGD